MFNKKNKPEVSEIQDSISRTIADLEQQLPASTTPLNLGDIETEYQPEIVQIVEKISAIVTPYFIAVVGLYLYEKNSLIGTTLIAVGIIALFKLPVKDLFAQLLDLLGVNPK